MSNAGPGLASKISASRAVLQVIDAPFSGAQATLLKQFDSNEDITNGSKTLPPHKAHTARILEVTLHSDSTVSRLKKTDGAQITPKLWDNLTEFLPVEYAEQRKERDGFRWLSDPLYANDVGSISRQWSQHLGRGSTPLARLVNRTSLQQHPSEYSFRPRNSYMTCAQAEHNRLIVIIVNETCTSQKFRTNHTNKTKASVTEYQNPRCTSRILASQSWTCFADSTLETFAKLLVLDFFESSIYLQDVDFFHSLLYPPGAGTTASRLPAMKNPHLQVPLGRFEPRLSTDSKHDIKEMEDVEDVFRGVIHVVHSTLFTVKTLEQKEHTGLSSSHRADYEQRMRGLEQVCDERGDNAQGALDALNRQVDFVSNRYAIRAAKDVRVSTLVAVVYLPLLILLWRL